MSDMNRSSLHVSAEVEKLNQVSDFVKDFFAGKGFDAKFCNQLDIVVEEIYVNIASYAYPDGGQKDAYVDCEVDNDQAILIFRDHGIPYNPLMKEDPVTDDPYGMTIGGYGIFMVKKIMDEVIYEYDESTKENILTMRKNK